ncbi:MULTISPECIES: hypothetical protein [Luteimonas]|uniref:hypothetical protein n=1 Tax=Luteimonas TaxID=83614 RepID=UPI00117CE4B3|nr:MULTISPECIES: hypothetical protein [Luteimonas]
MPAVFAQSTVSPQQPGDAGYVELLQAATAPVRDAFGDTVRVEVERLDRLGRWAFLQGSLRGADGGRPDYAGTPFAERAAQGGMSEVYVALLQVPVDGRAAGHADAGAAAAQAAPHAASPGADAPSAKHGDAGAWTLVDHAIGPSDVSWLTWPERHAAPRQLFGF